MSVESELSHAVPAQRHLRRSRARWRTVAFIAIAIALIAGLARFALPGTDGIPSHIGRVAISGVISTDPARLTELEAMANDDKVKAVIVAINSPGGTTAGGEELYEALSKIRAKKPVVAVIAELGASAAYMTAIAADHILARRLSIVGSIGVYFSHVDASKLMDTIGVNFDKVQTGPLKAEPDINDPLAGPARVSLQKLVDDSFQWFVDIVAERRGLTRDATLALADGQIVTGRMAVADGLIDGFGGEAEAVTWLEKQKGVAADLPILTHFPPPEGGLDRILKLVGADALTAVGLGKASTNVLDGLVSLWQAENLSG